MNERAHIFASREIDPGYYYEAHRKDSMTINELQSALFKESYELSLAETALRTGSEMSKEGDFINIGHKGQLDAAATATEINYRISEIAAKLIDAYRTYSNSLQMSEESYRYFSEQYKEQALNDAKEAGVETTFDLNPES
jgi:hypothetical protein